MGTLFREDLAAIRRAVDLSEWRGRAGTTERAVMREFIALAELRGTLQFGMNLRSIAERIGMSVSTVWSAIRRLRTKGYLKVAVADRLPEHSTTWHLCCPPWPKTEQRTTEIQTLLTGEHCSELRNSQLDIHVAADAFAGAGGKTRHRVWAALQVERRTVADLTRSTTLNPSSVRRILRVLKDLGLATHEGKMWRTGGADLDQAAEMLGTAGAGDRRRERHRLERVGFRAALTQAKERKLEIDLETGEVLGERPKQSPATVRHAVKLFGNPVAEVRQVATIPPN